MINMIKKLLKLEALEKEVASLSRDVDTLKKEIEKMKSKSSQKHGHKRNNNRRRHSNNDGEVVRDIHGNEVSTNNAPGMVMQGGDHSRTTRNLRKCKVWGCRGRNDKDGMCMTHYNRERAKMSSGPA